MTTLNGTTVYPSDIQLDTSKVGVSLVMASGTRRFAHRTASGTPIYKRKWTLTWDKATAAIRTQLVAVYALTTTFPFVDHLGASWTVQCEDEGYSDNVSLIAGDGTLYYSILLEVFQT